MPGAARKGATASKGPHGGGDHDALRDRIRKVLADVPEDEQAQLLQDMSTELRDRPGVPSSSDTGKKGRSMRELAARIDELLADVPEEEWRKLPEDLSETVDERLYKRSLRAP